MEPMTPWPALSRLTPARVGLGRAGAGLPTARHLDFQLAHGQARDAVQAALDSDAIAVALDRLDLDTMRLHSAAGDRARYLKRPDLGRRLDAVSSEQLAARATEALDLVLVIADGLSATAVNRHAAALIGALLPRLAPLAWRIGPVALVEQGRVAIGDAIGAALQAKLVAVLIGERPGLSAADSLGIYVTWGPGPGIVDAARNCISNVRPDGLPIELAAETLRDLLSAAKDRTMTGVALSQQIARESLTALPPR